MWASSFEQTCCDNYMKPSPKPLRHHIIYSTLYIYMYIIMHKAHQIKVFRGSTSEPSKFSIHRCRYQDTFVAMFATSPILQASKQSKQAIALKFQKIEPTIPNPNQHPVHWQAACTCHRPTGQPHPASPLHLRGCGHELGTCLQLPRLAALIAQATRTLKLRCLNKDVPPEV